MADNQNPTPQQRENKLLLTAMAILIAGCVILAIVGFLFLNKPADILEGQADATSVRISGKLPGRVAEFYVSEGDMVKAGDTLVHIHSSLAEARLLQAEAIRTAAAAQNKKIDAGTRSQIIQAAQDLLTQATAATSITKKTYDRLEALYRQGVVSEQKRDEAKAAYDAALAAESAARSQLNMAREGAQNEDKISAAAMVTAAQGSIDEVESLLEDQYLLAPCDGQIDQIYPQQSELVMLGSPIMSLLKINDKWVTFNVREDRLKDFTLGSEVEIEIPALDHQRVKAKIYYVRDLGSYATWRATKSTGQWDSKTFEVKARPIDQIKDLRPGMTVLYFEH